MQKHRDPYWDNLKFVLIFLVVLGHFLMPAPAKGQFTRALYYWIYIFHMQAFVFVSIGHPHPQYTIGGDVVHFFVPVEYVAHLAVTVALMKNLLGEYIIVIYLLVEVVDRPVLHVHLGMCYMTEILNESFYLGIFPEGVVFGSPSPV